MAKRELLTRLTGRPDLEVPQQLTLDHPIYKRPVVEIKSRCCICSVPTWDDHPVCDACAVSPAL